MAVSNIVGLLIVGVGVGAISGIIGIGGGVVVIPILMIFFGLSQQKANGTSLAMLLPPIGILAVITYAKAGNISWPYAGLLASGFIVGAYIGGLIVNRGWIDATTMRITFSLLLIYIAGSMLFRPNGRARAALETCLLVGGFAIIYVVMRLLGRHWLKRPRWSEVYREKAKKVLPYDYEI